MSITNDPGFAPASTPPGPIIAASASGPSGTIVIINEFCDATSSDDEAAFAPAVAISSTAVPTMS